MKVFGKHKHIKILILILLIPVLSPAFFDIQLGYRHSMERLETLTNDLIVFVSMNEGRFPANKQEFEPYVTSTSTSSYFEVSYGIQLTELKETHGKLYDCENNNILLIEGNLRIPFARKKYEACSMKIFEQSRLAMDNLCDE